MQIKSVLFHNGRYFYVRDSDKEFHTQFGFIKKEDLKRDRGIVKSNTGREFLVFSPSFIDGYKKIKRAPQIIPLKDVAAIAAETGINKNSVAVDAGCGSGALACFLANICKKVITYEIREDFIKVAEKNREDLNLKNLTIKNKDIYAGIDEKNVDLVTLDLPEPWKAISIADKALRAGGFLVSYSPTIVQTADFISEINKSNNFYHEKTIELIEREWDIDGRKLRPKSQPIGHSGFISFVRKIS